MKAKKTNHLEVRGPGRPSGRDASVRAALLDVALTLFARDGIAATKPRHIAQAARTTPAMVNYYFGDKAGLLKAVMEERVSVVMATLQSELMGADSVSGKQALLNAMCAFVKVTADNPVIPKLVLREVYSEFGALRHTFMSDYGRKISNLLLANIQKAQSEGSIRPDLSPKHLAYAFMSLTIYPVLSSPLVPELLGLSTDAVSQIEQAKLNFDLFMQGAS